VLLRYVTQNIDLCPVGLIRELCDGTDMLLQLVNIVENKIWERKSTREKGGKGEMITEKYFENKWQKISKEDDIMLTNTEIQIWISIYNLFFSQQIRHFYQWNSHRKSSVLALKKVLLQNNSIIMEQLNILKHLLRFLEELTLSQPPPPQDSAIKIIEIFPELQDSISSQVMGTKLKTLLTLVGDFKNPKCPFTTCQAEKEKDFEIISNTFNIDRIEDLLDEVPTCSGCGKEASKRCSGCKMEWYCSRECQVGRWGAHQDMCNKMKNYMETKNQETKDKETRRKQENEKIKEMEKFSSRRKEIDEEENRAKEKHKLSSKIEILD